MVEAKTTSTNLTWLYSYLHILHSVHLFCTRLSFTIDLFSNALFQTFGYIWKHVPTKLLISLYWFHCVPRSIDICTVAIKNIRNRWAVSTNQIADILHLNNNLWYYTVSHHRDRMIPIFSLGKFTGYYSTTVISIIAMSFTWIKVHYLISHQHLKLWFSCQKIQILLVYW